MSSNPVAAFFARLPPTARLILRTTLYGLAAGLAAVAFQTGIHVFYHHGLVELAHLGRPQFLVASLVLVVGTAAFSSWLLARFCPEAGGGGIPRLKLTFWKDFGLVRHRLGPLKFLGSLIAVGGGSSLGPEGPALQIGGSVASSLAAATGEPVHHRRAATAAGAAAGLAAAFNAPLAAVTFVLEEVVGDLNSRLIGGILLASVVAALVAHGLVGEQPAFALGAINGVHWATYLAVPVVAATVAAVGYLFQRGALALRGWNRQPRALAPWMRAGLGGFAVWALGIGVFVFTGRLGVFSGGYDDLSASLRGAVPLDHAALLLVAKVVATAICFGLGGSGGLFAPTLFFGGLAGASVAGLVNLVHPLAPNDMALLAVVGMSSGLASIGGAPVTSVLIVFEMTHEFAIVPPLVVAALVARPLSLLLSRHNIYDAILAQDGQDIERIMPPRDLHSWQHTPVSRIANFRPVLVRDTAPAALARLLAEKNYACFPVVDADARPLGLLTRAEAQAAVAGNRAPQLQPAPSARRETSIHDVQRLLIDSPAGMVLIRAGADDRIIGLVTLHDLLRAETAFDTAE
ncbi:MAG TPA: chloride channel protein [Opitutaceae bacterium]|nr:chloride channel protein [Opitutaceae bacterium]